MGEAGSKGLSGVKESLKRQQCPDITQLHFPPHFGATLVWNLCLQRLTQAQSLKDLVFLMENGCERLLTQMLQPALEDSSFHR